MKKKEIKVILDHTQIYRSTHKIIISHETFPRCCNRYLLSLRDISASFCSTRTIIYGSLFVAGTPFSRDISSDLLFAGYSSPSAGRSADDCYRRVYYSYNADVDRLYPQVLWERGYGGRRRATSHGPPAKARVPVHRRNLFAGSAIPKARQLPCYRGERRV